MRKLIPIIALAIGLAFTGCKATLEPGGAYAPVTTNSVTGEVTATQAPDLAFFNIESAYLLSYSVIDAGFRFERDNRAMLWKLNPNIKHTVDSIRPQAVAANAEYFRARKVYLANPIPPNLTPLRDLLTRINTLACSISAILPQGN